MQVGQTTSLNVQLQPGAGSESITVSGESPLLRTEDSNQSSVVNRELLDGLPLNGRRFLDFALLVPNATPDGQNGLVSFAGEQGGQDTGYANANGANSFSVDGASATSNYFGNARGGEKVPYIFGENAIEEFQVAVSPYRAEYGGAATGFVNVVTRSGSDARARWSVLLQPQFRNGCQRCDQQGERIRPAGGHLAAVWREHRRADPAPPSVVLRSTTSNSGRKIPSRPSIPASSDPGPDRLRSC